MSRQLPVPVSNQTRSDALASSGHTGSASSALVKLAIAMAPEILKVAEQVVLKRDQPSRPAQRQSQATHGQSFQISEVEIDTSIPFVRRVTVRNASSWSTFPTEPEDFTSEARRSRGKLLGLSGAAALVAAVMVRKAIPTGRIIDVQGKEKV